MKTLKIAMIPSVLKQKSNGGSLVRQVVYFGIIGVCATVTHYVVALTSHELVHVHIVLAHLLGYLSAVSVSYFGHAKLTFRTPPTWQSMRRFVPVSLVSFGLSAGALAAMEHHSTLSSRVTLALAMLLIPVFTFIAIKLWVYRN